MNRLYTLILGLAFVFFSGNSIAQEQAPLKTFAFEISLNKLKTEEQANDIREAISYLPGVKACELVLTEYELRFNCTNHDMNQYLVIDRVKAIVLENGAEIVKINRTEK